jgi:tetratricopeptide (TPR) repeat protein
MESNVATLALANEQFQAGKFNEAEESYKALLRAVPDHAEALSGLGKIAGQRGQHSQAVALHRQALTLQSTNPFLTYNLGVAYRAAGQRAQAEAAFRQSLRLKPDFPPTHFNLGNVLAERGERHEAQARYRLAVLLEPDFVDARVRLSLALRDEGRREEAADHLREAVQARPARDDAHGLLGVVLRELGRPDQAIKHLQQAVQLKPADPRHHFHLGWALQEDGRWADSTTPLTEAVRLLPGLAEAHHLLGRALLKLQCLDQARASLQQAWRLKPVMPDLHQDLARAFDGQTQVDPALARFLSQPSPDRRLPDSVKADPPPNQFFAVSTGAPQGKRTHVEKDLTPGIRLRQQGRLDEALAFFEKALRRRPNPAQARYELAFTLAAKNCHDQAIMQYHEALRHDPDFVEAYVDLGVALALTRHYQEASTALYHALRIQSDCVPAYVNLSIAYNESGDLNRAVTHRQHALRLQPNDADGHYQLGLLLTLQGKREEAVAAYREAIRLDPQAVNPVIRLGRLLLEGGHAEEGHRLLEHALSLAPNDGEAHVAFGQLLVSLGKLEEGKAHFLKALTLKPDSSWAYYSLSRLRNHKFTDSDLSRIRDLLHAPQMTLRDRIDLHFALAYALDRAKAFDEAFTHFDQANALQREDLERQGIPFRSEVFIEFVDRLMAFFDARYFKRVQSYGSASDLPIFIVGMPRSGSSLVEQILASHPAVFGAGEIGNMNRLGANLPTLLASTSLYPECLASLDQAGSRRLAEDYLDDLQRLGGSKLRVADKMLTNSVYLGLIATFLPRAQVIHCVRDPLDVGWSCYYQNFRDVPFACDLRALGIYYLHLQRLMAHWKSVLPMPIYEVCYEEIVQDTERISREMIDFCRLPWDDACLRFHETERLVITSSDMQVREPIYKKSVGKWKNYERHLAPLIDALKEKCS